MFTPSESAIARVMAQTGMDRLQAIRHLQAAEQLRAMPVKYPLGKTAHYA